MVTTLGERLLTRPELGLRGRQFVAWLPQERTAPAAPMGAPGVGCPRALSEGQEQSVLRAYPRRARPRPCPSCRPFQFPAPTHGGEGQENVRPYRTTWDALGDLPQHLHDPDLRVSGKWADLLSSIPEGHNYHWHTSRGGGLKLFGWRTRYWTFLLKLAKNRPSWTMQAQPLPATGPFHWANRKLSAQELSRLQTFPDDFKFDCPRYDVQRMIGNAVPSLLAEVLAVEIRRQFFWMRPHEPAHQNRQSSDAKKFHDVILSGQFLHPICISRAHIRTIPARKRALAQRSRPPDTHSANGPHGQRHCLSMGTRKTCLAGPTVQY